MLAAPPHRYWQDTKQPKDQIGNLDSWAVVRCLNLKSRTCYLLKNDGFTLAVKPLGIGSWSAIAAISIASISLTSRAIPFAVL